MTAQLHREYTPKVSVRLNRFENRGEILVTVIGDPGDSQPSYFEKLIGPAEGVGSEFDPIDRPHEVRINDGTDVYGGETTLELSSCKVVFRSRPPEALRELLFPAGAMEVTLPCTARSGEFDLSFTLPEGRSLLSLFFNEPPVVAAAPALRPAQVGA